jgi:hypothetical protein
MRKLLANSRRWGCYWLALKMIFGREVKNVWLGLGDINWMAHRIYFIFFILFFMEGMEGI